MSEKSIVAIPCKSMQSDFSATTPSAFGACGPDEEGCDNEGRGIREAGMEWTVSIMGLPALSSSVVAEL